MRAVSLTADKYCTRLTIPKPDDFHVHLRDGDEFLALTVQFSCENFRRILCMPNLQPPVRTTADALEYRNRILKFVPESCPFTPLMTLYMTKNLTSADIRQAKESGVVLGIKLYPKGATTNSEYGVSLSDIAFDLREVLREMEIVQLPLLIHGEMVSTEIDIFDREKEFIIQVLEPLLTEYPRLKVVMEHITTEEAVNFILRCGDNVGATITPHHLLYNRSDIFCRGINPHLFCLPILKREKHRQSLILAATSGNPKFFLGTDSAPHLVYNKESSCGCAGIFSGHAALCLYAEVFESVGKLDRLEDFSSTFGARFYNIEKNTETITIEKFDWLVPNVYELLAKGAENKSVKPLRAGEIIKWRIVN